MSPQFTAYEYGSFQNIFDFNQMNLRFCLGHALVVCVLGVFPTES